MIKDHIRRGDYSYQIAPRIVFSVLRIADPFIGIYLLNRWVDQFADVKDVLGSWQVLLFLTCVLLAALHQILWAWYLSREQFSWFMALFPWNQALELLWVYFLSVAINSNVYIDIWVIIGASLFMFGTALEISSNYQRKRFKQDRTNQGKLYTDGLFSIVIHPNYAGYVVWRSALSLMTGYPVLFGFSFLFHMAQFYFHADPPFQRYMHKKYGLAWERYVATHKKIIPWLI